MKKKDNLNYLAGIQYLGIEGISRSCKRAIIRLIHFGDAINKAMLLTSSNRHCFLLTVNYDELVAVKSGFSSGYAGEGSSALSTVLQLLKRHGTEIKEYLVSSEIIKRIDKSCLTIDDVELIESSEPIRPIRWYEYIREQSNSIQNNNKILRSEFPTAIPFCIIDPRLVDVALDFSEQPDHSILSGYRRLEDIVRKRTALNEHSTKLFAKAFQGDDSLLIWDGINSGEQQGRASLFIGTYMAFRNRRAHRETSTYVRDSLQEFILLKHLYSLESDSTKRKITKINV